MTGIYQIYTTNWALRAPDLNRRGTKRENRQEANIPLAFIGLVPGLNTNRGSTFKHQQHLLNTNGTFKFFKLKIRLKLRVATQGIES
jgi:hypothetical protein